MNTCRATALLLIALAAGALHPVSANAAAPRTGATRYVRLVRLSNGRVTIALTARGRKAFRRDLRGNRLLAASCVHLRDTPQGVTIASVAPPAPTTLRSQGAKGYRPIVDPRADFCNVDLARVAVDGRRKTVVLIEREPLDAVPLTRRGSEYLHEDQVAANLWTILLAARLDETFEPGHHFPSAQLLVTSLRTVPSYGKVVVLDSSTDSPPAGTTGVYSDANRHVELVALSAIGARLFTP